MINKKKTYTHADIVVYRHNTHNTISTYDKIGVIRSIGGVVCVGVGLGTAVIPFTTAPLIMLGSWLLGYDSKIWIPKAIYKVNLLGRWVYCNRSVKRLYRTIKNRVMKW